MINMHRMTPEQTILMIEQLMIQVGWSEFDLLQILRKWYPRFFRKWGLKDGLEVLAENEKAIVGLFSRLLRKAPFKIRLDNLDDREGCVMIECNSQIQATHDQTIAGSKWECPGDMDIAYAMPLDHPDLLKELRDEGYEIDDDEYCPPDPHDYAAQEGAKKIAEAVDKELVDETKRHVNALIQIGGHKPCDS